MARTVNFGGGLAEMEAPQYTRQRAMADALMGQSMGPVSGWGEGVANLAKTAAGVFLNSRADKGEKAATSARAAALKAALASGDPMSVLGGSDDPELQGMALQYQMAQAMKDPAEKFSTLTDAEEQAAGLDPSGTYQRSSISGKTDVLSPPKTPFKPSMTTRLQGGQEESGYLDENGQWVPMGAGPRWQPQQAPADPDRVRRAKAGGLVEGTPEFQKFVLGSDTPDPAKPENILRDEFNTLTKDFRTVQDAYSKIETTSPTGAGDMSMLYSYVKLLDPGSVVRESEFATAAASGSFGERVQGAVQQLATGERLPDSLRASFKEEAKSLFKAQQSGYDRLKKSYTGLAERSGADPQNVIVDYAMPEQAVDLGTGGPQAGGLSPDERGGQPGAPVIVRTLPPGFQ